MRATSSTRSAGDATGRCASSGPRSAACRRPGDDRRDSDARRAARRSRRWTRLVPSRRFGCAGSSAICRGVSSGVAECLDAPARDRCRPRARRAGARSGRPRAPRRRGRRRARSGTRPRCAGRAGARCGARATGANCALSIRTSLVPSPHLGLGAAHHARERDRALRVGDHEVRRAERARLAVERGELLARARARARAPRRRAASQVERVQRLAELEQHQVRDVDDVVDRAHARGFEPRCEPVGRRADAHAAHDARARSAGSRRRRRSRRGRPDSPGARLRGGSLGGMPQRAAEERAHLARDAEHARPSRRGSA